ncbi:MAG: undecaprenyl/decaprenyl-phosphate alpha-N-acetylglucosaminyl 1-phosphate transferase [Actinobacteria bacterium]|jgi:UDP-GlcNAc:undecaprenyl-phosphate GlcNAc-1-phosphate transferase|nr:undecaprenyl/decaprenyl-phosphate alpha-N-acetylglucosaminyl 1-phosphate transferase [Actinomycetota bacterium]
MMLISAVVTFFGTFSVLKLAHKYKIYPAIRSRDVHTRPTPRLGGVAMFAGFLVTVVIAGSLGWFKSVYAEPVHIIAIVGAAFLITLIGFLDDLYDLDWSLKLAGQFLVAGILAWQGVQIVSLPIGGLTIGSFGISFIATVFLAVLVMNAVNFIDGLDGLVAGVVFIGTAVFFAYSYLLAQQTSPTNYFNLSSLLSAIVLGMCIGFLPYNWHRAKIFMGDSGAMLLGLLMATSALTVTGQIDPQIISRGEIIPAFIPLILPLAILILPLLDFALAVFRRLRAGKSPFAADREHIHHRLQDFGHSHLGSVLVFYVWTALISLTCLLFFFWPNWAVWLFLNFGLIAALIFTLWPLIQRRRKLSRNKSQKIGSNV